MFKFACGLMVGEEWKLTDCSGRERVRRGETAVYAVEAAGLVVSICGGRREGHSPAIILLIALFARSRLFKENNEGFVLDCDNQLEMRL